MRVTASTKEDTRRRILDAARKLFAENGFDGTTTRDIAGGANIATGTLFNYFASKEALAMAIVGEALESAEWDRKAHDPLTTDVDLRDEEALVDSLFSNIAADLRELRPFRPWAAGVLDSSVSPLIAADVGDTDCAATFRARHLEQVVDLLGHHTGGIRPPSLVTMHLYWTLYLGVLVYWSRDPSPDQQDSLALLDQSLRLFVRALRESEQREDPDQGATHDVPDDR
jgi:AcrR family transcriptional regulator